MKLCIAIVVLVLLISCVNSGVLPVSEREAPSSSTWEASQASSVIETGPVQLEPNMFDPLLDGSEVVVQHKVSAELIISEPHRFAECVQGSGRELSDCVVCDEVLFSVYKIVRMHGLDGLSPLMQGHLNHLALQIGQECDLAEQSWLITGHHSCMLSTCLKAKQVAGNLEYPF